MTTDRPTLVVGARAGIGRAVLDELLATGHPVRASARTLGEQLFPAGVEAVRADLGDAESLRAAFDGVERAFVLSVPGTVPTVVDAARAGGVRRLVLLSSGSVLVPSCADNPITIEHREVEESFAAAADLEVVPVRPLVLATNDLAWARQITRTGTVSLYRPEALDAPIHERDIAGVVVAALTGSGGPVGDLLTGPDRVSQRERVARIGRALGRELVVHEQTRPEMLERMSRFVPATEAEAILRFLDNSAAGNSPATGVVEAILGRPAIGYDRWVHDHLDDFR